MSLSDMVHVGRAPIAKLIVGPGEIAKGSNRGLASIGFVVTSQLLKHCRAPPSDIYDPSVKGGKGGFRDEHGHDKAKGERLTIGANNSASSKGVTMHKVAGGAKGRAAWAYDAFKDYGGLYCDRIALGAPPQRVAVLQPHAGLNHIDRSVSLVMAAHRHLDSSDVLLVYPTRALPFGGAALTTLRGTEQRGLIDPLTQGALIAANEAMVEASRYDAAAAAQNTVGADDGSGAFEVEGEEEPAYMKAPLQASSPSSLPVDAEAGLAMSVLSVGIGGIVPPSTPSPSASPYKAPSLADITAQMTPKTLSMLRYALAPRLAYACAYWCSHPAKAAQFLAADFDRQSDAQSLHHHGGTIPYIHSSAAIRGNVEQPPRLCAATFAQLRLAASQQGKATLLKDGSGTSSIMAGGGGGGAFNSRGHVAVRNLVEGIAAEERARGESATADGDGAVLDSVEARSTELMRLYTSKAMQRPLLSTTNQRIMTAYGLGMPVVAEGSMGEVGTLNAATKIMERIREEGYWAVPRD